MKSGVNQKKLINTAVFVNAFLIALIVFMLVYIQLNGRLSAYIAEVQEIAVILYAAILILISNSIFSIKYIIQLIKSSTDYNMLSETNRQLEKLNNTLRFQRHDFINHLQVVYSLIEMDEFSDAKDYIEKVYNDIQKVNKILKTSNAAINALLQAKLINAEKLSIEMTIEITTQLKGLNMPAWEFCRVLGNLLDNAIYVLNENTEKRLLKVELYEDIKSHGFKVTNNGAKIPGENLDKIFQAGFTTKSEKGDGMGLAIVKELLQQYGGDISVYSEADYTEFKGWIPKSS